MKDLDYTNNSISESEFLESPSAVNQQVGVVSKPEPGLQAPIPNVSLYDYLSLTPAFITALAPILVALINIESQRKPRIKVNKNLKELLCRSRRIYKLLGKSKNLQ